MMKKNIMAVMITIATAVLAGAYFRNLIIGSITGVMIGILVSVPLVILIITLRRFVNKEKIAYQLIHVTITILAVATVIIWTKNKWSPSPATLFKRIVQKPIPTSVTNIQSVVDYLSMDHTHRLRFNIDDNDILKIIASNNFQSVDEFPVMEVLEPHLKKVSWWNPNTIKSPKLYVAHPKIEIDHFMWVDTDNHVVYYQEFKY